MHEFDCKRCGIHVVDIVGTAHPEKDYCLECRFIESLGSEAQKREASRMLGKDDPPEGHPAES